ncbi:MAG TPA: futalosine hydrolase [Nitrospirae bacterium]|nr:futalosine hydrolase [Nitrospirota bacterium]
MTGLICAVEFEYEEVLKNLSRRRHVEYGGLIFCRGLLRGRPLVLVASGVGKTNAAHAATLFLEKFRPEIIINFGVGGAYPESGISVGGIAVADQEIYGDEGVVTPDGFMDMRGMGIPLLSNPVPCSGLNAKRPQRNLFNRIPIHSMPIKKACRILKKLSFSPGKGPFVTLSTVTGTAARAAELQRRYSAICENMEGASVAHICMLYGVPFLEIRGISNIVEDRDKRRWRLKEAAAECQRAVMGVVSQW